VKEYILLFNTNDEPSLKSIQESLPNDAIVKNYGLVDGNKVDYTKSIWVTEEQYSMAYKHLEIHTNEARIEEQKQYWINNGAVIKE